jgi:hypothetical protein
MVDQLDDDGLDIDAIFGGGSSETPNPFTAPEQPATKPAAPAAPTPVEKPSAPTPPQRQATPVKSEAERTDNLIEDAFIQQETKSLFEKAPVFSYGGATEDIQDTSVTFEELRIAKSDDFPELGEGKKVSWSVEYGKTVKMIADPKSTTIASVKEEIERSKAFLDGLKKAKEKSPDCLVKPRVTAQSKGIAAYKGVFLSREDAEASDKRICLFPARDGQVYELRKTEMGDFIAPKSNVVELSEVKAGFIPALPPIPWKLFRQIVSFFRYYMNEDEEFEALAHIYWDRENACFEAFIPNQIVGKARVSADLRGSALPEERYLHYADIHSHNSMAAKFSFMDDEDEKATRLYFVVGRLERYFPAMSARISCGGAYQEIDPALVIEGFGEDFPQEWLGSVTKQPYRHVRVPLLPAAFGEACV